MGERRNCRDAEAGATGVGSVRRQPAGLDADAFLPDLCPSGPWHPADGRVLRCGPARRRNGTARTGLARRPGCQPGRGVGSADAGDPADADVPRPHPERPSRPADDAVAAAQRSARRAQREAAFGNQSVRAGHVRSASGVADRVRGAAADSRSASIAAQASADVAGGAGRGYPQSGPAHQPGFHGTGFRTP